MMATLALLSAAVATGVISARRTPPTVEPNETMAPPSTGASSGSQTSAVPVASCTNAPPGWPEAEDSRQGNAQLPAASTWPSVGAVTGYVDAATVDCGQKVRLYLSSTGPRKASVTAYRVGAYRGGTLRSVWASKPLTVSRQAIPAPRGETTSALAWRLTTTITPDASWPPGYYLVKVAPLGGGAPSWIPLRIQTSGTHAPLLAVASDLTQMAYNTFGGKGLYVPSGRYAHIATPRPLYGSGLVQVFVMDVPLARLLAEGHLAADWTSDSALDANPRRFDGYAGVVLPGHSEYWTKAMYDALQAKVAAGTNLAVLGANEIYWQARLQRDRTGHLLTMTVYRSEMLDPIADPSLMTVQWRSRPLYRDPAALTGVGMSGITTTPVSMTVTADFPWVFRGTSLQTGTTLVSAAGNELDAIEGPTGRSPSNTIAILTGKAVRKGGGTAVPTTTSYYSARSGAGVFAAGSTFWLCSAMGACRTQTTPLATRAALARITVNVLKAFSSPLWGATHPSLTAPHD